MRGGVSLHATTMFHYRVHRVARVYVSIAQRVHVFFASAIVRFPLSAGPGLVGRAAVPTALPATTDANKPGPFARLGFSGDSAPARDCVGGGVGAGGISPVTRLRNGARPLVPEPPEGALLNRSVSMRSVNGVLSPPSACLRAFSCLICTDRKWERSSCHLISSLPSFDRVFDRFGPVLQRQYESGLSLNNVGVRFGCDVQESR